LAAIFLFAPIEEINHSAGILMIRRIKICDFKSIREVELELDPVTVLVGRSGTGKSNLVQAIRFLRNFLLDPQQAVNYEFGWERIIPAGQKGAQPSLDVHFTVPGEEREYNYLLGFARAGNANPTLHVESLALGNDTLFSRFRNATSPTQWNWKVAPKVEPMPHPGDGPMLGSFPSLQQVVFAYAALSSGIGYYHLPASVLGPFRGADPWQEFLKVVPGLSDNAANYREVMRGIIQDFRRANVRKDLLASLRQVNPNIEGIELDSLVNPQKAIVGHKANGTVFELSLEQESDGFRRFYAHLLALYQTPPKLTMVFEEPENAIFPGALSLLAEEFQAAAREDRGQVILTTHSPILLDSLDVENVRAVELRDGWTVVGRVSKEQRQAVKDHLLTTGELLTVDAARLDQEKDPGRPG
jgi:predicted ATPase